MNFEFLVRFLPETLYSSVCWCIYVCNFNWDYWL